MQLLPPKSRSAHAKKIIIAKAVLQKKLRAPQHTFRWHWQLRLRARLRCSSPQRPGSLELGRFLQGDAPPCAMTACLREGTLKGVWPIPWKYNLRSTAFPGLAMLFRCQKVRKHHRCSLHRALKLPAWGGMSCASLSREARGSEDCNAWAKACRKGLEKRRAARVAKAGPQGCRQPLLTQSSKATTLAISQEFPFVTTQPHEFTACMQLPTTLDSSIRCSRSLPGALTRIFFSRVSRRASPGCCTNMVTSPVAALCENAFPCGVCPTPASIRGKNVDFGTRFFWRKHVRMQPKMCFPSHARHCFPSTAFSSFLRVPRGFRVRPRRRLFRVRIFQCRLRSTQTSVFCPHFYFHASK